MFYIQAGVNQSSDYFMFDVTNGIYWLRDLILKIVIIPENLYIKTHKLIVEEGKEILVYCSKNLSRLKFKKFNEFLNFLEYFFIFLK